jgi:hypothetical protein
MTHCVWCTEPVQTEDITLRFANGPVAHHGCAVRMAIGSVAHPQRCCDCSGPGSTESDRLCRNFCSGGREGAVAPVCGGITRPGSRTVRPQ